MEMACPFMLVMDVESLGISGQTQTGTRLPLNASPEIPRDSTSITNMNGQAISIYEGLHPRQLLAPSKVGSTRSRFGECGNRGQQGAAGAAGAAGASSWTTGRILWYRRGLGQETTKSGPGPLDTEERQRKDIYRRHRAQTKTTASVLLRASHSPSAGTLPQFALLDCSAARSVRCSPWSSWASLTTPESPTSTICWRRCMFAGMTSDRQGKVLT